MRAWLALCRDKRYKNYRRSLETVKRNAGKIAQRIDSPRLTVVSLGAGQGDKDFLILKALRAAGKRVSYLAVDTSRQLLEITIRRARQGGFPARQIQADLTGLKCLSQIRKDTRPPRLHLLLGNTLGGFDPVGLARLLGKTIGENDYLLVDGEIHAGRKTLEGYDHPANRRFAFAPLKTLRVRESDGDLKFELRRDRRRKGLFYVHKFFAFKKGGRIEMSRSYKYQPAAFRKILKEAGFKPLDEYRSRDRGLLMQLACLGRRSIH